MSELSIPHVKPIRFVEDVIVSNTEEASIGIQFEDIPTLGMLVEAAAQSSSGILNDDTAGRIGFVVSLKNIKLLQKPQTTTYQVDVKLDYKMEDLKYLSFRVVQDDSHIAEGSLVIALQ